MEDVTLTWDENVYTEVVEHLRGAPERVAFMRADTEEHPRIVEALLIDDAEVIDGQWCVELSDGARRRVLQWASPGESWLIEAHSHLGLLGDPAAFSPLDLAAFAEWVPHVRWRLRWRPYGALVFGPRTFDGLAWRGGKTVTAAQIGASDVAGQVEPATGRTLANKGRLQ